MATLRRKKAEPFSVFQRDPGPWPPILLNWMATLAIIMVFGLVMLFSASYTTGYLRFGDSFHYIKSQLLCTVLGLGMMFLFSYFDHRFLRRMVKLGYVVCLILLVLVLFSSPINGCRRWISFGGLTLQASEVAKFEMILLTADIAARTPQIKFGEVPLRKWVHHSIVVELIRPILWLVPVLILLVLEPHMSGILLTTAIVGTILLLGGSGGIITWGCAGAALFLLETLLKHVDSIDYLQSRLDGWTQDLDRMTSQTKQSLYAIGSGGATGLGLGLPLCQAIARGHGGRLLLQSGPEGTTVTVSLPDRRCTKTVLREPPFAYGGGFHPVLLGLAVGAALLSRSPRRPAPPTPEPAPAPALAPASASTGTMTAKRPNPIAAASIRL